MLNLVEDEKRHQNLNMMEQDTFDSVVEEKNAFPIADYSYRKWKCYLRGM